MLENRADLDPELCTACTALIQSMANDAFWVLQARLAANTGQMIDPAAYHTAIWARHPLGPSDFSKRAPPLALLCPVEE